MHTSCSLPIAVLSSAPLALVYVLILSEPPLDLGLTQTRPSLVLDSTEAVLAAAHRGRDPCFCCLFWKGFWKTSSRSLASGASRTIKWWSYWRCCARSALRCQTLFFFTPPHPLPLLLPPPYLPHLESIKELWEEGKNLSTGNVFTMPGKARGTPFIRLKHPCWIFWGLFLFFGGKFHEPLNQSFTCLAKANPPPRPPLLSKHGAVCCCCCSSSAGGHMGKVSYHTP